MECSDKTYYTGIAKDPEKRLNEHNQEKSGAKYTRARRPVKMVYKAKYKNRSMAQKEEIRIKKLARKEKKLLII